MDRIQVRFEQKRGFCAVVEGSPPFQRGEMDDFRLRMLQACDVPGLLKPDPEEIDGRLSLRYPLSGTRMLSQALRSDKWSMAEFMTALCRLAEVMEDCRFYALEGEQILLREDLMFMGEGWHDLRLIYLPADIGRTNADDALGALIVRWMLEVSDLDGTAVQEMLRIAGSPGFKPAALRSFTRQYLSVKSGAGGLHSRPDIHPASARPDEQPLPSADFHAGEPDKEAVPPATWRWFQPPDGDRHSLSGLLGDDADSPVGGDLLLDEEQPLQDHRRRIWLVCGAISVSAAAWRFGYAQYPSGGGLLFSLGMTITACAGLLLVGLGRFAWGKPKRRVIPVMREERVKEQRPRGDLKPPSPPLPENPPQAQLTGRLPWRSDLTQQLDITRREAEPAYYLVWESAVKPVLIALDEASIVIGRSKDAASHVDDTQGVSRAHAELLRTVGGWTVKDLGSRNGTKINDVTLVPYEPYALQAEDSLDLAGSHYRFKYGVQPE